MSIVIAVPLIVVAAVIAIVFAVKLNSQDPGIYSNLGVEYASRGDTNNAILYNEKSVGIDPRQEKAHANLGIL